MKSGLLKYICCPYCKGDLAVGKTITIINNAGKQSIKDGLLVCQKCNKTFAVMDNVPRLLKDSFLNQDEVKFLAEYADKEVAPVYEEELVMTEQERFKYLEKFVREKLKPEQYTTPKLINRIEHDIQYRVYNADKKDKYVYAIKPYLNGSPKSIVDVGGGQGGNLSCFCRHLKPEMALLIDLDADWGKIASLRDPDTEVVRADAANLPIKDKAFDLFVSASALEHIENWQPALDELLRIAKQGFLNYGPNGAFPFDFGHIDAPVFSGLSKSANAYIAAAYHAIRRTGRNFESLKKELDETHYIRRSKVEKLLNKKNIYKKNIFREFVHFSLRSDYHYCFGGPKQFLLNHEKFTNSLISMMLAIGAEPFVYYFISDLPISDGK